MIYQLSARSEGIAFWCFGELETYWTEWFIDVHWLFCRDCNELHVLFRMHYRRNCIFLAPPWFRTSPNKSWIYRPSKSRSIFEFRLFVHWCIGLWRVFYSILEVSDAALPPETQTKWVSNRIEFQPKSFATSEKSNDFGHHFNHFHPRHVQAENLAHQHFNDLFKQYPSSFIQVH